MSLPTRWIGVPEFALRAGLHPDTVRDHITTGEIKAHQRVKNSPYRIPESELVRFLTPNCGVAS